MKTSLFFSVFSMVALALFLIWAKHEVADHDTTISVSENRHNYSFRAVYDARESDKVQQYLNQCISPVQLGNSGGEYVNVNTTLADHTHFYVRESPGKLEIKLDKRLNTSASYQRIRAMCEGVKQILAGKKPAVKPENN